MDYYKEKVIYLSRELLPFLPLFPVFVLFALYNRLSIIESSILGLSISASTNNLSTYLEIREEATLGDLLSLISNLSNIKLEEESLLLLVVTSNMKNLVNLGLYFWFVELIALGIVMLLLDALFVFLGKCKVLKSIINTVGFLL